VNGLPCASCPTRNLPASEITPGDVVTMEVYLSAWDLEQTGIPLLQTYEWLLDNASLTNSSGTGLAPRILSCSNSSDCTQGSSSCSCYSSQCDGVQCDLRSALYVDAGRSDYVFAGYNANWVSPLGGTAYRIGGTIASSYAGVGDPGTPRYVGTLELASAHSARGIFELRLDPGSTFALDDIGAQIESSSFSATIQFCDQPANPTDCNQNAIPDQCEPDSDADGAIDECDPCPVDALNDSDGDGACDSDDGCPNDPGKTSPGLCGCGLLDDGDSDGDAALDCVDQCPGVNDSIFAPGCIGAIPAASTWGLLIFALALLVGAKTLFAPRNAANA